MSINMYLVMKYKGTFWNLHFEFGYTKKFFDKVSLLVKNDYLKISMLAQMKMPTKTIALKYSATENGSALRVLTRHKNWCLPQKCPKSMLIKLLFTFHKL